MEELILKEIKCAWCGKMFQGSEWLLCDECSAKQWDDETADEFDDRIKKEIQKEKLKTAETKLEKIEELISEIEAKWPNFRATHAPRFRAVLNDEEIESHG